MSILSAIHERVSVRTYTEDSFDSALSVLKDSLAEAAKGPFGNPVRLRIVDMSRRGLADLKKLGSYGIIRGAKVFLAGSVKPAPYAMEDFGYVMETMVLKATGLGLGTVWLGGFLSRGAFAEELKLGPGEVVPAVSPVGIPEGRKTLMDHTIRFMARSSSRKPARELFFDRSPDTPLAMDKLEKPWAEVLEAVRLAPSASNKQPWRIVRGINSWHFYLDENKLYNNAFADIHIQNVDMGIAMAHFELSARELGLPGKLQVSNPEEICTPWNYIASWK